MHPAVRAHIDGNLAMIRMCMAQIEAALAAEEMGHQSSAQIGAQRAEKEQAGIETPYLRDEEENLLQKGFAEMWEQAKQGEPSEQVTNETNKPQPVE